MTPFGVLSRELVVDTPAGASEMSSLGLVHGDASPQEWGGLICRTHPPRPRPGPQRPGPLGKSEGSSAAHNTEAHFRFTNFFGRNPHCSLPHQLSGLDSTVLSRRSQKAARCDMAPSRAALRALRVNSTSTILTVVGEEGAAAVDMGTLWYTCLRPLMNMGGGGGLVLCQFGGGNFAVGNLAEARNTE